MSLTRGNSDTVNLNLAFDVTRGPKTRNVMKWTGLCLRGSQEARHRVRGGHRGHILIQGEHMDILDAIINAQGGAAVRQVGAHVGLAPEQTTAALSALLPALAAGAQRNIQAEGGLASLLSALSSGNHGQYIDSPGALGNLAAVTDGNGILGHLLGSKDVSRSVATRAAAQTGLSADVLKRLLPLAATLMMGALSKQPGRTPSSAPGGLGGSGGGIADMLGPLLDRNRDGSIVDDVTSMIGRFIKS